MPEQGHGVRGDPGLVGECSSCLCTAAWLAGPCGQLLPPVARGVGVALFLLQASLWPRVHQGSHIWGVLIASEAPGVGGARCVVRCHGDALLVVVGGGSQFILGASFPLGMQLPSVPLSHLQTQPRARSRLGSSEGLTEFVQISSGHPQRERRLYGSPVLAALQS